MAVGADRRIGLPAGDQLPMNAFPEILLNISMAFAAGLGNVEMIDGGSCKSRSQDLMSRTVGRMTVVASSRQIDATERGLSVDATFIELDRLAVDQFVLFCQVKVFVAAAASLRKVQRVDPRIFVGRGPDIMSPVAVGATRDIGTIAEFTQAMILVNVIFFFMAITAHYLFDGISMRQFLNSGVTIDTIKTRMNRIGQSRLIRSVNFARRILMAFHAFRIFLSIQRRDSEKQSDKNCGRTDGLAFCHNPAFHISFASPSDHNETESISAKMATTASDGIL